VPRSLVDIDRRFRCCYCLHYHGFYTRCRENLKSRSENNDFRVFFCICNIRNRIETIAVFRWESQLNIYSFRTAFNSVSSNPVHRDVIDESYKCHFLVYTTTWSRVLLEKLTVGHVVTKIPPRPLWNLKFRYCAHTTLPLTLRLV
jgi:hypothetical protein